MATLNIYSKEQTDNLLGTKQETLISGTNIRTVNGQSLLGSSDLVISGGSTVSLTDNTTYFTLSIS